MLNAEPLIFTEVLERSSLNIEEACDSLTHHQYHINTPLLDNATLGSNDWKQFCQSWNDLCLDKFMADGGTYRFRRFSTFSWNNELERISVRPHSSHFQLLDYNTVNGGVSRHYEPFTKEFIANRCFQSIISHAASVFSALEPGVDWYIEAHQFRIVPDAKQQGKPTPEGIHRDGRDYVFMLMPGIENIAGGESTLYDSQSNLKERLVLRNPSDAVYLNDRTMFHGVSAVSQADPNKPAHRDMLVITFVDSSRSHLFSVKEAN